MQKKNLQYSSHMPIKKSKIFSKLVLITFLMFSSFTFSQPPPPFDDDVNDELPINSHLIVLFGVGVVLGYFLLKKKEIARSIK